MCCCHPAGSPPPLSDSPSRHPTAPAQISESMVASSVRTLTPRLRTDVDVWCSNLTLESSSCVLSSSSPFFVLLIVVWLSSSLFTERGSRSDDVVPVASFRSGGEELREV